MRRLATVYLAQTLITDLEHIIAGLAINMGGVVRQPVGDEVVFYSAEVNAAADCACHVQTQDGAPTDIRRETLPLRGRGRIALGARPDEGDDHILELEWG
jgi:hypothetical protein